MTDGVPSILEPLGRDWETSAGYVHVGDLTIRTPPLQLLPEREGNPGRVWELYLPGYTTAPISANDQQGPNAGVIVNGKRRDVAKKVGIAIRDAGWPELTGPVEIGLVYYLRNNGWADPDNIAPTLKPCIDAMKPATGKRPHAAGVLPEDHGDIVRRTWQEVVRKRDDPHPERGPRLWLIVTEVV